MMKNVKRVMAVLLSVAMTITLMPSVAFATGDTADTGTTDTKVTVTNQAKLDSQATTAITLTYDGSSSTWKNGTSDVSDITNDYGLTVTDPANGDKINITKVTDGTAVASSDITLDESGQETLIGKLAESTSNKDENGTVTVTLKSTDNGSTWGTGVNLADYGLDADKVSGASEIVLSYTPATATYTAKDDSSPKDITITDGKQNALDKYTLTDKSEGNINLTYSDNWYNGSTKIDDIADYGLTVPENGTAASGDKIVITKAVTKAVKKYNAELIASTGQSTLNAKLAESIANKTEYGTVTVTLESTDNSALAEYGLDSTKVSDASKIVLSYTPATATYESAEPAEEPAEETTHVSIESVGFADSLASAKIAVVDTASTTASADSAAGTGSSNGTVSAQAESSEDIASSASTSEYTMYAVIKNNSVENTTGSAYSLSLTKDSESTATATALNITLPAEGESTYVYFVFDGGADTSDPAVIHVASDEWGAGAYNFALKASEEETTPVTKTLNIGSVTQMNGETEAAKDFYAIDTTSGTEVTLPTTVTGIPEGKTFAGWGTAKDSKEKLEKVTLTAEKNEVVVYAIFEDIIDITFTEDSPAFTTNATVASSAITALGGNVQDSTFTDTDAAGIIYAGVTYNGTSSEGVTYQLKVSKDEAEAVAVTGKTVTLSSADDASKKNAVWVTFGELETALKLDENADYTGTYKFTLVNSTDDTKTYESETVQVCAVTVKKADNTVVETIYGNLNDTVALSSTKIDSISDTDSEGNTILGLVDSDNDNKVYKQSDNFTLVSGNTVLTVKYTAFTVAEDADVSASANIKNYPEGVTSEEDKNKYNTAATGISTNINTNKNTTSIDALVSAVESEAVTIGDETIEGYKTEALNLAQFNGKTKEDLTVELVPVMEIVVNGVELNDDDQVIRFTVDITPKYQVKVSEKTTPSSSKVLENVDEEIDLSNQSVEVSVPIPSDFVSNNSITDTIDSKPAIRVKHATKESKTYFYMGTVDSDTLTFTNPHGFSDFEINASTEDMVATVGSGSDEIGYTDLQDAVDECENDATITIVKAPGGGNYSVKSNGKSFKLIKDSSSVTDDVTVKVDGTDKTVGDTLVSINDSADDTKNTGNLTVKIGETSYESLQAAVDKVTDGQTIYVTADNTATAEAKVGNKTVTFNVNTDSNVTVTIKNDKGTELEPTSTTNKEDGTTTYTYSVTYVSSGGGGGGSSASSSKVSTPTKTDGGSISVSSRNPAKGDTVTITAKPNDGYKVDSITVTDKNGKSVEVKDNGDGTYTFTMPDTTVSITPKFVKDETKAVDQTPAPQADTNNSSSFTDVPASQWYAEAVDFVTKNNIMNGTGNGKFSPNANLTRAMLMTMLARYDGTSTDGGSTWYEKGMQWAVSKGVSDGTKPEANITREQLVTMLYRYAGAPEVSSDSLSKFNDASGISSYARSAVAWAASNGIIDGMTDGSFAPQNSATRAQVAKIFMSYANLKDQSNQPAQDDQTANTDQTTDQTTNTDQATDQTASTDQATDQTANTDQATDQTTGTDQSAQAEQTEKTA